MEGILRATHEGAQQTHSNSTNPCNQSKPSTIRPGILTTKIPCGQDHAVSPFCAPVETFAVPCSHPGGDELVEILTDSELNRLHTVSPFTNKYLVLGKAR